MSYNNSSTMASENLLVELLVEELPPKALDKLGRAFASVLADSLKAQGLAGKDALVTHFATPRRLAAHVTGVAQQAADKAVSQKLMPVGVGLDASGKATPALIKRLQALGADASAVAGLKRALDGKTEALFHDSVVAGATLAAALQKALDDAINKLPIPKVMTYQLEADCALPGWSSVSFVRPAHGLLALHGANVVPVQALGLRSGNTTQGHRFEAAMSPVVVEDADSYAATLLRDGAVLASFAERRAEIVRQLVDAAVLVRSADDADGGESLRLFIPPSGIPRGITRVVEDNELLNEVTALVERPKVLICEFEKEFLEVPQECLILTMKANQKYFPLLDAIGKLTNKFLVVSNISPADAGAVISGNERVVRPRLADAKFFFDQDRKKTLESRVEGLSKVVYHNKLGTQGERMERVRAIAKAIGQQLGGDTLAQSADTAARLAKTDLLTDMVGEFPELQGVMGGYYARHDGLSEQIAIAIEDHYKPRFAGDGLPRNQVGIVLALADKLETLVGMFGIGNLPTGDKDPFALRRHALGVIRMLVEEKIPLDLDIILGVAQAAFGSKISGALSDLERFVYERLKSYLKDVERPTQGLNSVAYSYSSQQIEAVLALRPQRFAEVTSRVDAVMAFESLPEAPSLAAANKRITNILKKAQEVDPHVSEILLTEPAEISLYASMKAIIPKAEAQFEAGDYTGSLQTMAALRAPVDAFFDNVMVNAQELDVRLNRQGLLKSLHNAMNRVADLSRLAA